MTLTLILQLSKKFLRCWGLLRTPYLLSSQKQPSSKVALSFLSHHVFKSCKALSGSHFQGGSCSWCNSRDKADFFFCNFCIFRQKLFGKRQRNVPLVNFNCGSAVLMGCELIVEGLAVQNPAPTEVAFGQVTEPQLLALGIDSALHGSSHPLVC